MQSWWEKDGVQVLAAGVLLFVLFQFGDDIEAGVQRLTSAVPPATAESAVAEPPPRPEPRCVVLVMPAETRPCRPALRCH